MEIRYPTKKKGSRNANDRAEKKTTRKMFSMPFWRIAVRNEARHQQHHRIAGHAQKGMLNIFLVVFFSALSFAFLEPFFFVGYLISIALFGLYQALFMANAGGAWDNAKKVVETELRAKGTPLHDATVVGDTVGDPFKDTSSVALNPIIKFTTLFGVLAVSLAVDLAEAHGTTLTLALSAVFFLISLVFVYRSFYGMRIESGN